MSEERRRRDRAKPKRLPALRALLAGMILGPLLLWVFSYARSGSPYTLLQAITAAKNENGAVSVSQKNVPYLVNVDFVDVLLDQARQEKKLIVYSQNATVSCLAEKEGLFGWAVYAQAKSILFHGVGTYSVDMAQIRESDILVDPESLSVEIHIPDPVLSVEYLPEQTEFLNTSNGILRFGEMQITPEMMTELETLAKARIREIFESDTSSISTARKFAALSVKEILEPVLRKQIEAALKNADDQYAVPPFYSITVVVDHE